MSKIHGNIRKILFSGNNGYTVGLIKVRECSNDLKDFLNKTITFTANVFEINMEINYVLEGEILLCIDNKVFKVKKGETFYYDSNKNHYLKNNKDKQCRIIWVSSPPNF